MTQFLFCQRPEPGKRKPIDKRIAVAKCRSRECDYLIENQDGYDCTFSPGPRREED